MTTRHPAWMTCPTAQMPREATAPIILMDWTWPGPYKIEHTAAVTDGVRSFVRRASILVETIGLSEPQPASAQTAVGRFIEKTS